MSPRVACAVAAVLFADALSLSAVAAVHLLIVLAVSVAVQLACCYRLKHQRVLDVCVVASGFLLRDRGRRCGSVVIRAGWLCCAPHRRRSFART